MADEEEPMDYLSGSDEGEVPPSPSNKGEVPPSPIDEGEIPPSPIDKGEVPTSPSDKGEVPPSPIDEGEVPPSPIDEGEVPPSPSDEGEVPPSPSDEGEVPPSPINDLPDPASPISSDEGSWSSSSHDAPDNSNKPDISETKKDPQTITRTSVVDREQVASDDEEDDDDLDLSIENDVSETVDSSKPKANSEQQQQQHDSLVTVSGNNQYNIAQAHDRDLGQPSDDEEQSDSENDTTNKVETSKPPQQKSEPVSKLLSEDRLGAHDDHGELDYEEDVEEVVDKSVADAQKNKPEKEEGEESDSEEEEGEHKSDDDTDGELSDDDEDEDCEEGEIKETLEEGEQVDSDTNNYNNQPICRFFLKGSCTWGNNCRFYHPGTSDAEFMGKGKGYQKTWGPDGGVGFARRKLQQPDDKFTSNKAPPPEEVAPPPPPAPPPQESAWERGLRHAKELRKRSQKRKENEPDFEEKRKNLTISATDDDPLETQPAVLPPPQEDRDFNKENEREKPDSFDDGLFVEDEIISKQPVEGWHGSGRYENFEVRWTRDPHPSQQRQQRQDPYPDFRIPERDRMIGGERGHNRKEKFNPKYRYEGAGGNERYDRYKDGGQKPNYERFEDFEGGNKPHEPKQSYPRTTGEQWADPWQRVKSPSRRRGSRSRSRSPGRRRTYSRGSESSYTSSSYSRSRSSSFSSSRSSSYSSRSSSRSLSPPPRRKHPPPGGPDRRPIPSKPNEGPRSFVAKAGPIVPMSVTRKNSDQKREVSPHKPDPPDKPSPVRKQPAPVPVSRPPAPNRIPEGPPNPPAVHKPAANPPKPTQPDSFHKPKPTQLDSFHKPKPTQPDSFHKPDTRPGRSLRRRPRDSSASSSSRSRSRSWSSSGSSSRSRSRSSSGSSSSFSSKSGSDSDDLYRGMASPTKTSKDTPGAPKHNKAGKKKLPAVRSREVRPSHKAAPPPKPVVREKKPEEAPKQKTAPPPLQPLKGHISKDPLKLQGQKSNIKLTLKSDKKVIDTSNTRKRLGDDTVDTPPPKKAKSPPKEVKEPVRITLPKTDKVVKPVKENPPLPPTRPSVSSSVKSSTTTTISNTKSPVKAPTPVPAPVAPVKPPEPAPAPHKKKSTSSRREELLKQLKAVEDAIARKRTK